MPLAGESVLTRQLERIQAATVPFQLVVATTTEAKDQIIRDICKAAGVQCFDGHPTDLLDRHYQVAAQEQPDAVVKIPSDCPLIDPAIIDKVLNTYIQNQGDYDFVSNLHPATYPDGNDVEVFSMSVLETAWREAKKDLERQHTTPFIWEQPERFRIMNVQWESGLDYSMSHRFTIDYQEDYEFIKVVYDELWRKDRPIFSLEDILDLLERQPEIYELNSKYAGVNWYRNHIGELKTITSKQTKQLL